MGLHFEGQPHFCYSAICCWNCCHQSLCSSCCSCCSKWLEERELDDDDDELLLEFDECRLLSLVAGAWSSLISLSKITHGNPWLLVSNDWRNFVITASDWPYKLFFEISWAIIPVTSGAAKEVPMPKLYWVPWPPYVSNQSVGIKNWFGWLIPVRLESPPGAYTESFE